MAKIKIDNVSRKFEGRTGEVHALEDIVLEVADGEFAAIIGPSGCGKSTLLNIIAGLDKADSGQVVENDRVVSGPGRDQRRCHPRPG